MKLYVFEKMYDNWKEKTYLSSPPWLGLSFPKPSLLAHFLCCVVIFFALTFRMFFFWVFLFTKNFQKLRERKRLKGINRKWLFQPAFIRFIIDLADPIILFQIPLVLQARFFVSVMVSLPIKRVFLINSDLNIKKNCTAKVPY